MKKFIDNCNINFLIFCFGISLIICSIVAGISFILDHPSYDEQSCYYFYKDNGYVLDNCFKYTNKLTGGAYLEK